MSTSGGSSGSGTFVAAVTPTTVTDEPNPVAGSGTMKMMRWTGDDAAIAWGVVGDAFPRILFTSMDGNDGWYFGDGTFDPYADGPSIAYDDAVDGGESILISGGANLTRFQVRNALVFGEKFEHTATKIGFFGEAASVQPAAIADAAGGATIDTQARTAINAVLAALRLLGLIDT